MKLINKTHYNSAFLLSTTNQCIDIVNTDKIKNITFKYHKSFWNKDIDWCGGWAFVGGSTIVIKLPKNNKWIMNSNIGELENKAQIIATVIIHEIGHLLKIKHYYGLTIEHIFSNQIKEIFEND